ncbi:hypothetical protein DUZ99_12685 [Xylanibacillus composti]|uniref:M23ase beta-sheet core domain-containing protein n=1 Tax=Xylanibacillus composti TaxID=1572762 RepID=A0A8J4H5T3_9BACL|nr:M23 family metallopeptidase [Xylanibacillus composti]MDT9725828.1 hypothetical protein [Xylanibacillus composti]GIQ69218.1 hypothetical protein XYCOK13_20420 [Xylanibacillus composti]
MKKKRSHTLTFVMVPEADQQSRQFRIPKLVLWSVPATILGLIALVILQVHYYQLTRQYNAELTELLALKESELQMVAADKDRQIQHLHNNVIEVSRQAEQVQHKVQQLRELENELRGIANPDQPAETSQAASKNPPVTIASAFSTLSHGISGLQPQLGLRQADSQNGIGGQDHPLDDADMLAILDETGHSFESLSEELDDLSISLKDAKEKVEAYQHLQRITPSIWPTAYRKVTSTFGTRKDPFTGRWSFHSGIDIAGSHGSSVYTTADGVVTHAGYSRSEGYNVIINHSNGIKTHYMHLSKITVEQGESVEKGDIIGQMGSTGRSTGTHLHYEVIVNGQSVDPKPYMKSSRED